MNSITLDSLVPAPTVAQGYVNREIKGFSDFDTFQAAKEAGHNVLIKGPTGTGKTYSVRAYAATQGLPYYTVALNQAIDFSTLFGTWVPDGTGSLVWQDGVITAMVREGKGCILLDEINMASERALARLYGLLDDRRELVLYEHNGEVLRIAPGSDFLIAAAYNPGYRGTRPLSQALPNRFAFKMHYDYDTEIEAQLIPLPSVREMSAKLRALGREVTTPVSTNMQMEFCEIAIAFSTDYAIGNWVEAFDEHEQAPVQNVVNLFRDRIAADVEALTEALQ